MDKIIKNQQEIEKLTKENENLKAKQIAKELIGSLIIDLVDETKIEKFGSLALKTTAYKPTGIKILRETLTNNKLDRKLDRICRILYKVYGKL